MKRFTMLLASVLAVSAVLGVAYAAEKEAEAKPLKGKIVEVADAKGVLKVMPRHVTDPKGVVSVVTNGDTVVSIDGKEAKVADLTVNMAVTITHVHKKDSVVASKIEAKTPKKPQ